MNNILKGLLAAVLGTALIVSLSTLCNASRNKAQPIRLIGMCHGQLLGGLEEDHFPEGCKWIEPVNMDATDVQASAQEPFSDPYWKEMQSAAVVTRKLIVIN